jgi:hypothetical protein
MKLERHVYIYSSIFAPQHWTVAHSRLRELEGVSISRHFIQLLRCSRAHTYADVRSCGDGGTIGRGQVINEVWMTGTDSTELSCLLESAEFVRNVIADSAGIIIEGPMPVTGGRYEWVRVRY